MTTTNRIRDIMNANDRFQQRISTAKLPVRAPETLAVITCMDPRINLESIGIPAFSSDGEGHSDIRIIRSIGAMAEPRSLIIGMFLAGIREFVVLMHTDCGCCLAHAKIDTIIENMERRLESAKYQTFKSHVGEPFRTNLMTWLKVFEDPYNAIQNEIANILTQPFVPDDILLHGLLYHTATGAIEVVVNGYKA
jgi:carbonic anhydrase